MQVNVSFLIKDCQVSSCFDAMPVEVTQKIFLGAADAEIPERRFDQLRKYSSLSQNMRSFLFPLLTVKNLVFEVQEKKQSLPVIPFEKLNKACNDHGRKIHYLHFGSNVYSEEEVLFIFDKCPNLCEINFNDIQVTEKVLKALVDKCPKLTKLAIFEAHLKDLQHLKEMNSLQSLRLGPKLTVEDEHLKALPSSLRELAIDRGSELSEAALHNLEFIESLRVNFYNAFSDASTLDLEKISHLRSLTLGGAYKSDTDRLGKSINCLSELTEVDLTGLKNYGSEKGYLELAKNTQLRKLSLMGAKLSANTMDEVGKMDALEELKLTGRVKNFEGIYSLKNLKSLDVMQFANSPFALKMCDSKSTIEELTLGSVEELSFIKEYTKLKILKLANNRSSFNDEDMACLEGLPLKVLVVMDCGQLSDKGLNSISQLKDLESLILDNAANFSNLDFIKEMPHLKFLSMSFTDLSGDKLEILKESKSLHHVYINTSGPVTPNQIDEIVSQSRSLIYLHVQ